MGKIVKFIASDEDDKIIGNGKDRMSRINFLIEASSSIADSPPLRFSEWCVLIAAAKGFDANYSHGFNAVMYQFSFSIRHAEIYHKEGIDRDAIAEKFNSMSNSNKMFVFELARKAWHSEITDYRIYLEDNSALVIS